MPMLAALMVSIFNGLINFFVTYFSKKVAIGLAAVAIFFTLTVSLFTVMTTAFSALVYQFPADSSLAMGLWVAVPPNFLACLSAAVACDTAVALYRWNVENLRILSYIT